MGGYFFDEPQTKADFVYWSKIPKWTLDQIVALSLGKDPRFVSSDKGDNPLAKKDATPLPIKLQELKIFALTTVSARLSMQHRISSFHKLFEATK